MNIARNVYGSGEVFWGNEYNQPHESGWLALEIAKARTILGYEPRWSLAEAVQRTVQWYCLQNNGADVRSICEADIICYESSK